MDSLINDELEIIVAGCQKEEAQKLKIAVGALSFCYELFRRAIVERSDSAWEAVCAQYQRQMRYWAYLWGDETEDCLQAALLRFYSTVTPERFSSFPDKSRLLGYLRRCIGTVKIDRVREEIRQQKVEKEIEYLQYQGIQMVVPKTSDGLASAVEARLNDEVERIVMRLRFQLGLKPAEIARRYPQYFKSSKDVSKVLDRVIKRLREDPVLKMYFGDNSAPKKPSSDVGSVDEDGNE